MNAKLNTVLIKTQDMAKSISFYEQVLEFALDSMISMSPDKQKALLRREGSDTLIELETADPGQPPASGAVSLSFVVEQIGAAEKALAASKVRVAAPPRTLKGGKKIMTAVDPNGVELHFIEE